MLVPWNARVMVAEMRDTRYVSSPKPSELRPQRASRVMSTIGAKVMSTPSAAASIADTRPVRVMAFMSQVDARPRLIGNTVRWPWTTSKAKNIGILLRLCPAASCIGAVVRQHDGVERAADAACGDFLENLRLGHLRTDADQAQLTDLLVEGHLLHQVGDECILGWQRGSGADAVGGAFGPGGLTDQADDETQ